jgi:hypothetical protein
LALLSRSNVASSETTWSWFLTWENWQLTVTKSFVAMPRSHSSSNTLASSVAFSERRPGRRIWWQFRWQLWRFWPSLRPP